MWFSAIYAHVPYGKSEHHSLSSALPNTHTHTYTSVVIILYPFYTFWRHRDLQALVFIFKSKTIWREKVLYFRNLDLKYQEKKSEGDSHDP